MSGTTVLILGCGDMGSAVAHWLFRRGARVLLCDRPRPAHARRGMAFTDALFEGTATLEGITARFAETTQAVECVWHVCEAIPIVTLGEQEITAAFRFDVAIDATMRRHLPPPRFRTLAASTIGLGPGFTPGENCHVAVETQWGESLGTVVRDRGTQARTGGPARLAGIGRERFVQSSAAGIWHTDALIGQSVDSDQEVGRIGAVPVRVPFAGTLRGLTHDCVDILPGQIVVEIDPRDPPQVFGLGSGPVQWREGYATLLDWICRWMPPNEGNAMRLSARNALKGIVRRIEKGAVNAEVTLELAPGQTIVSIITLDAVESLGLKVGNSAYAVIKASSVMVGVD